MIAECTHASDEERITFPQVVGKLMAAGVERYHADLVRDEKIYYMPDGQNERTRCHAVEVEPSHAFTASGVAVTVGQALLPLQFLSGWCRVSIIGKNMLLSGFF